MNLSGCKVISEPYLQRSGALPELQVEKPFIAKAMGRTPHSCRTRGLVHVWSGGEAFAYGKACLAW